MSDKRKLVSLVSIAVIIAHWNAAQAVWILSHPFSFNRYYIGIYYILCVSTAAVIAIVHFFSNYEPRTTHHEETI